MSTLRRTVEGWMGDVLYQKLGNEPCTEVAWSLLRDLVGQQAFGTDYVAVPYIQSAPYYNQQFVFIKQKSVLNTLRLRPPTYKVIGNMDYLVNRDVSTWVPQFDLSPWDIADSNNMYREYKLRISSNQVGVEKLIHFTALESHARGVQPPVPLAVSVRRDLLQELRGVSTLYVITDVVLASYVKLMVRIDNRQTVFIHDRDMPIGFRYHKYKLRKDGTFVAELNTRLKVLDTEAIWLRPCPQPIPTVPRWDAVRRGFHSADGRRKKRNNLTIPTHPEVPSSTQAGARGRHNAHDERGWARRRNNLPFQRFLANEEDQQENFEDLDAMFDQPIQRPRPLPVIPRTLHRSVSMETMPGSE